MPSLPRTVTAPTKTGAKASHDAGETGPNDLAHIRVGPPFTGKQNSRCAICGETTKDKTCAIVENTRSEKRKAVHEECLKTKPELLARRDAEDLDSFLL